MPIGGTSYQPTAPMQGTQARPQLSPQEAVRVLSLRLPKAPQNLPVPAQLLTSQGGGGVGSLTALVQALMRAAGGESGGGGSKELVDNGPGVGIDNGMGGARPGIFTPRININDGDTRARVDEPPVIGSPAPDPQEPLGAMPENPLYDAGIPRIRRGGLMAARKGEPLF